MTSTTRNISRNLSRNPGVYGKACVFMPEGKVNSFKTLFAAIQKEKGSERKAMEFVGIGYGTLYMMRDDKLTEMIAKRIMSAYQKLQKSKT